MKPNCECFKDEKYGAEVKAAMIGGECSMVFIEEMNTMGLCHESLEYCLIMAMTCMARDAFDARRGGIGMGRKEFETFCVKLGERMREMEEELELKAAETEAKEAVKQ